MSVIGAGAALKAVLVGLLEKLPSWIESERQSKRQYDVITRFESDLHILIETVDRVVDRQGDIIEQQQATVLIMLRLLMDRMQNVAMAGSSIAKTGITQQFVESINSAHRIVVDSFQSLPPPVQDSAASLEVVARWEMTSAPYFIMCDYSLQFKGWTILTAAFGQSALYLAIQGSDPALAKVRYGTAMLKVFPVSSGDWEELLKQSLIHFDEFVELPGDGMHELAVRLERHSVFE